MQHSTPNTLQRLQQVEGCFFGAKVASAGRRAAGRDSPFPAPHQRTDSTRTPESSGCQQRALTAPQFCCLEKDSRHAPTGAKHRPGLSPIQSCHNCQYTALFDNAFPAAAQTKELSRIHAACKDQDRAPRADQGTILHPSQLTEGNKKSRADQPPLHLVGR